MTEEEAATMAEELGLTAHAFDAAHTDVALEPGAWRRLIQRKDACTFLTQNGSCGVYEVSCRCIKIYKAMHGSTFHSVWHF